jgi:hypothetical protein
MSFDDVHGWVLDNDLILQPWTFSTNYFVRAYSNGPNFCIFSSRHEDIIVRLDKSYSCTLREKHISLSSTTRGIIYRGINNKRDDSTLVAFKSKRADGRISVVLPIEPSDNKDFNSDYSFLRPGLAVVHADGGYNQIFNFSESLTDIIKFHLLSRLGTVEASTSTYGVFLRIKDRVIVFEKEVCVMSPPYPHSGEALDYFVNVLLTYSRDWEQDETVDPWKHPIQQKNQIECSNDRKEGRHKPLGM